MEDSPTVVKLDQGGNQGPPVRKRRCLPKALGYITGDMKEFANWLKGIYASIPWSSGFGGNGLLVLLVISLVILPYLLSISFLSLF